MTSIRSTVLGIVCLALSTLGCSFDRLDEPVTVENRCFDNSECPGASCDLGMCVASIAPSMAVTLEVTPASAEYGIEPPAIVLPPFSLAGADERLVTVPDAIVVFGDVRVDDVPVSATLRFHSLAQSTALNSRPVTVKTSAIPLDVAMEVADYSAPLLADSAYRVTVTPTDGGEVPPLRLLLSTTQDATQRFDAVYDSARFVTQRIVVSNLPLGSWSATAIDPTTGEPISTRATVSADNPAVELTSVSALGVFDVQVALVSEPGNETVAPTFRIPNAALVNSEDGALEARLPLLSRAVSFTGTVEHCRDLLLEAVVENRPAMSVALRSRSLLTEAGELDATASFATTSTATFDSGLREWSFSASVPAGQYEVVVTPSTESECGVFAETRMIQAPEASSAAAALLQLPTLSFLSGSVRAGGQVTMPMMGAAVVANALGLRDAIAFEPSDDTVTRYNRSQQTTTDMLGEFTLPIDVGAYDVIVKPPVDSGFAWRVLRDVNVGARTETPFDREIEMTAPVLVRGTLRTSVGMRAMTGATIRAYTTTDDAERGQRALPIGVATADADGRFTLLLPANIDRGWY